MAQSPDIILPTKIEHATNAKPIKGLALLASDGCLLYEFELESVFILARAYISDMNTVYLSGPFKDRTMKQMTQSETVLDQVLVYLEPRFEHVVHIA